MTLWDWSLQAWRRPGVEAAALERQDRNGESVALILWRAWAGPVDEATAARAEGVASAFEAEVLSPLRQARRALKGPREGFQRLDTLKGDVRAVELAAERRLLAALEQLTPEAAADAEAGFQRLAAGLGL